MVGKSHCGYIRNIREAAFVGGLYRKALTFHDINPTVPETSAGSHGGNGDGISAEERAKISSHIEDLLAGNRKQISPQALEYSAKRRGAMLPIISNVVIFVVFVVVGFVIFLLLNHQEKFIATGQATVLGAENKLIAAMKKQTEAELAGKDEAILDAQKKLQGLSQEQQRLRDQADSAVKAKEQALRADFETRLSAEKARLERQGLSAAAQSRELRDFQAARQREIEAQLAAARRQADVELSARQKSLAVLASQYQNDLDAARQQRLQMQAESAQKEASLRSQASQGLPAAQSGVAAQEELARLQAQREKDQLVLDQLLAGYSRVNAALQGQDLAAAQKGLDSLRAYLNDPSVATLPTIQKRRGVEIFLIDSLDDLVRSRRSSASPQAGASSEAAAQVRSIGDLVARGDALSKTGNLAEAHNAYLQALRVIPSVDQGYLALEELRSSEDQQKRHAADAGLQKANVFYQAGDFLASLSQYRQAVGLLLGDEALASQLTDNVMNAGYRILAADDLATLARLRTDEQKRQAILKHLEDMRSQYLAYAALPQQSSSTESARDKSLASLLQAKILLRQILDSAPIRSQYPTLSANMERYFAALEQQGKVEGRAEAMGEVASMLEDVSSAGGQPGPTASSAGSQPGPAAAAANPVGTQSLVNFLDRLQQLLAGK
ncbi:MAG: hypothetical protein ACLQCB_17450 [Spirochaetia bacterium]